MLDNLVPLSFDLLELIGRRSHRCIVSRKQGNCSLSTAFRRVSTSLAALNKAEWQRAPEILSQPSLAPFATSLLPLTEWHSFQYLSPSFEAQGGDPGRDIDEHPSDAR